MCHTLSPPLARPRRLPDRWLQRLAARLRRRLETRRQRRELALLDTLAQHELNDLGIGRGDLARLARDLERDRDTH